jgi:hypothetical protein
LAQEANMHECVFVINHSFTSFPSNTDFVHAT